MKQKKANIIFERNVAHTDLNCLQAAYKITDNY